MIKSELIQTVAKKANLSSSKSEIIVDVIFETMVHALKKDIRIEIRGFGSFANRYYSSYKGRNPRTGEIIHVKKKRLPFFKVGKELKDSLNPGLRK